MRNALILSVASLVLFPLLKPLGWLLGGLVMLAALLLIGFALPRP